MEEQANDQQGDKQGKETALVQGVPFTHCQTQTNLILSAMGRVEKSQELGRKENREDHRVIFGKVDTLTEGVSDLKVRVGKLEGEVEDLHAARGSHAKAIRSMKECVEGVGRKMNGVSIRAEYRNWKQKWLYVGVGAVLFFILIVIAKSIWPNIPIPPKP